MDLPLITLATSRRRKGSIGFLVCSEFFYRRSMCKYIVFTTCKKTFIYLLPPARRTTALEHHVRKQESVYTGWHRKWIMLHA
jgi:hypothetical protein